MSDINMQYHIIEEKWNLSARNGYEVCIVVLSGICDVYIRESNITWKSLGSRKSVFDGAATIIYIPVTLTCEIVPLEKPMEIVEIYSPSEMKTEPFYIQFNKSQYEKRGSSCYQRVVHTLLDSTSKTYGLVVGETFHNGVWSGYPPHKHDIEDFPNELDEKECYFIKIYPTAGFGIFINYTNTVEDGVATILCNNSIINVDSGYHCIASSPDCKFYYLWALYHPRKEVVFSVDETFIEE